MRHALSQAGRLVGSSGSKPPRRHPPRGSGAKKRSQPRSPPSRPSSEEPAAAGAADDQDRAASQEHEAANEELATLNQELQDRNLQLRRELDYANGIVETVRDPLLILDAGLRVERANRTFYDFFRVTPAETVGRRVYELDNGQWDIPALRQALADLLPKDAPFEDFEIEHDFPRIGRRTLVLNARTLRHDSGQESILLAIEDRTEVRKAEEGRQALLSKEQQARKRAEQSDRIKDEFCRTMAGMYHNRIGYPRASGGIEPEFLPAERP